jgi:hypothetical protein
MAAGDRKPDLSAFQLEVSRLFFALPASQGFLLAGEAALTATRSAGWSSAVLMPGFDRAAARDFADVYVLAHRFGKDVLLARAAQIDAGFDAKVLTDMFATLDRFTDDEIPVPDGSSAAELRTFYSTWQSELAAYSAKN